MLGDHRAVDVMVGLSGTAVRSVMVRTALIVGSLAVAWSVPLWTWLERPSDDDRAALIERMCGGRARR